MILNTHFKVCINKQQMLFSNSEPININMQQTDTINRDDSLPYQPSSFASSQKQEDDPSFDSQRGESSNEKEEYIRHQTLKGEIRQQENQDLKAQNSKQQEDNHVKIQEGHWQEYNLLKKQEGHWQEYSAVKVQEGYWKEAHDLKEQEGYWQEYNAVKGQEGYQKESYVVYKKKNRKGKKIKNDHPIKNFLQDFRKSFLDCIRKGLKDDKIFNEFQIIARIKRKKCINLRDFQDLFNEKTFRPILKSYFKQKQVIRDLLKSRVRYPRKREYFKRVNVFEEAFMKREFNKIYY